MRTTALERDMTILPAGRTLDVTSADHRVTSHGLAWHRVTSTRLTLRYVTLPRASVLPRATRRVTSPRPAPQFCDSPGVEECRIIWRTLRYLAGRCVSTSSLEPR